MLQYVVVSFCTRALSMLKGSHIGMSIRKRARRLSQRMIITAPDETVEPRSAHGTASQAGRPQSVGCRPTLLG
jgi:hypothetical protein